VAIAKIARVRLFWIFLCFKLITTLIDIFLNLFGLIFCEIGFLKRFYLFALSIEVFTLEISILSTVFTDIHDMSA